MLIRTRNREEVNVIEIEIKKEIKKLNVRREGKRQIELKEWELKQCGQGRRLGHRWFKVTQISGQELRGGFGKSGLQVK